MKEKLVLLVEDNEGDVVLTIDAFKLAGMQTPVFVVRDGEAAINFLCKQGIYNDAPTPDLILLDINLPKINGNDILRYIKQHDELKAIPVIVFTSSQNKNDIKLAYENDANCFITKSNNILEFRQSIFNIRNFWLKFVNASS